MKTRLPIPTSRRRRPALLVAILLAALLLGAAVAIPAALVLAQDPPSDEVVFVNASLRRPSEPATQDFWTRSE